MKNFQVDEGGVGEGVFLGRNFFKGGGRNFLENFMGFLAVLGRFMVFMA